MSDSEGVQASSGQNVGEKTQCDTVRGGVVRKAFGLDLAGYSTGRSALAMATVSDNGPPTVTILTGSPFSQEVCGSDNLPRVREVEVACLQGLLKEGPLFIDVPIDLQGLPSPKRQEFVWQLTKRPVDQAFGGLPPLADKIGACVVRVQYLWGVPRDRTNDPLREKVFETYPAGSLKHAGKKHEKYKGRARYIEENGSRWQPRREDNDRDMTLAELLADLTWTAVGDGFVLTHDEFDAALCALTGVCTQLKRNGLQQMIAKELAGFGDSFPVPSSYVLLKQIPLDVRVCRRHWEEL